MPQRVALVTGGTGTIGRKICRRLLADGHRVVANCHPGDVAVAEGWAADLTGQGAALQLAVFDVTDYEQVGAAVAQISETTGVVEILVNAAGITRDATLTKLEPREWNAVLSTNLDSVYNVTRPVISGMIAAGFGRVVNISSVNGQRGQFGQSNYSAAKAGMHGFTMAVAREVARKGVTVNSVSPGYIDSPLIMAVPERVREAILDDIPVGRFGTPVEIARVVSFLTSEESGYITGANIPVNGGYHMA